MGGTAGSRGEIEVFVLNPSASNYMPGSNTGPLSGFMQRLFSSEIFGHFLFMFSKSGAGEMRGECLLTNPSILKLCWLVSLEEEW